LKTIKHKNKNN